MLLLFVRHGETDWNRELRYQGQHNTVLNAAGLEQAQHAALLLEEFKPTTLYTSDLRRTVETASIIGTRLGLQPRLDPRLREIDFGLWEGKTFPEVLELFPEEAAAWRNDPLSVTIPGGEDLNHVLERVLEVTVEVCSRPGEVAILVTHGGSLRLLLNHIDIEGALWRHPLLPGSIRVIECVDGRLSLERELG